jgi:hypothetical protein
MAGNKSEHILNTSSNLLGFCLIVLTSLKISKYSAESIIDELTGIATILLMASSFFSFLSIRSQKNNLNNTYERIAEIIFMMALLFLSSITCMIAFSIIF